MATKAIVFIDGNWLYKARPILFGKLNEPGFEIDYRKMPKVICEDVANFLDQDVDLVRTCYFGTIPSSRNGFSIHKQGSFYNFLEGTCGYEIDIHELDSNGGDENWVESALISQAFFYACQSNVFDIAIIFGDSANYEPALRRLRMLGKRVQIVGIHGNDGKTLPADAVYLKPCVSDFPPIFLDNHASNIRLVRETRERICKQCGKPEKTTWAGPEFFCAECRGKFRQEEGRDDD